MSKSKLTDENKKDIIFIGANVYDSGTVDLIGFSIPRLLPRLIDSEEMMSTRVLNPKDYDDIPTYHNGTLKFNTNTLMFVGKFMTGYLFADGMGKLFCFEFNEVIKLRDAGNIEFKGCKIVVDSFKQKENIKFTKIPGVTIEKLRCGDVPSKNLMDWETYVEDTHRYYGNYSYLYSILARVFRAFVNKLDLMVSLGFYKSDRVNRELFLRNARIMDFANEYYYKTGNELGVVEGFNQPKSSIAFLKLDVASSLGHRLLTAGNLLIYQEPGKGKVEQVYVSSCGIHYLYLDFKDTSTKISYRINVDKFRMGSDGKEYLTFMCNCEGPDDNNRGLYFEIKLYSDGNNEVSTAALDMVGRARGNRKGFEWIAYKYFTPGLEMYMHDLFSFNTFVDKELSLKHKIYRFKHAYANRKHPELQNHLGIHGYEVEDLMLGLKTERPTGKLVLAKVLQLNRYEFIKLYTYSNKKTNMYAELYMDGKAVCGCPFEDTDKFDYVELYKHIHFVANWHIKLAQQNYEEYVNDWKITLDNRWYEAKFLRHVQGVPKLIFDNIFGFCIAQDMLTGIYFLCYVLYRKGAVRIDNLVGSDSLGDYPDFGSVKMCAFKDKKYAVEFMKRMKIYLDAAKEEKRRLMNLSYEIHSLSFELNKNLFEGHELDFCDYEVLAKWLCRSLGGYGSSTELIKLFSGVRDIKEELGIIS